VFSTLTRKLVRFFKVLFVDWFDHEVEGGSDAHQRRHGVHGVVVDEGGGVDGPLGHDGHQLGDGQGLGFDQSVGLRNVDSERRLELGRVHLRQQIMTDMGYVARERDQSPALDTTNPHSRAKVPDTADQP